MFNRALDFLLTALLFAAAVSLLALRAFYCLLRTVRTAIFSPRPDGGRLPFVASQPAAGQFAFARAIDGYEALIDAVTGAKEGARQA